MPRRNASRKGSRRSNRWTGYVGANFGPTYAGVRGSSRSRVTRSRQQGFFTSTMQTLGRAYPGPRISSRKAKGRTCRHGRKENGKCARKPGPSASRKSRRASRKRSARSSSGASVAGGPISNAFRSILGGSAAVATAPVRATRAVVSRRRSKRASRRSSSRRSELRSEISPIVIPSLPPVGAEKRMVSRNANSGILGGLLGGAQVAAPKKKRAPAAAARRTTRAAGRVTRAAAKKRR